MAYQRRLRLEYLEGRQLFASDLELSPPALATTNMDASNSLSGEGVRAAEVRIQFDPEKVSPQATDFLPGPAWQGKGAIVTNVDSNEGTVTAFLFSIEPINAASGDLIDIRLPMGPTLRDETIPAYAIESITVDEGQKSIDPAEHRVDPVVSEEIKRQVQSRIENVEAITDGSPLSNNDSMSSDALNAVDSIYGPSMPNWLNDDSLDAESNAAFVDVEQDEDESVARDDSSWADYLNSQSGDRDPSRSTLLIGVRDDWSELDRMGHRKA